MKKQKGDFIFIIAIIVLIGAIGYFGYVSKKTSEAQSASNLSTTTPETSGIEYQNNQYGFIFTLPESWAGYSVLDEKWQGQAIGGEGQELATTGPQIIIRHPKWTSQKPRQDIPIMIFNIEQWNDLQADKFHIGAAPIGPAELGRNLNYVFALPARYNYAFPEGYEEVERIMNSKPLKVI